MLKFIIACIFMTLPTIIFAKVNISKEYSFSPELLQTLESKIQLAFIRDTKLQDFPSFNPIDSKNGISLWCPPHQPTKDGTGCTLKFFLKMQDGVNLTISKDIFVNDKSKDIMKKLSELNPNTTQEHQHFGSLFGSQDTSGSHYFCQPDGTDGSKVWNCFLFVSESFN